MYLDGNGPNVRDTKAQDEGMATAIGFFGNGRGLSKDL